MTATITTPPVTGCEDPALASQFHPSLEVKPVQESPAPQADQPTGLAVNFHFPQTNDPTDLSTVFNPKLPQAPELKTATVKLPAGLSLSPASAERPRRLLGLRRGPGRRSGPLRHHQTGDLPARLEDRHRDGRHPAAGLARPGRRHGHRPRTDSTAKSS